MKSIHCLRKYRGKRKTTKITCRASKPDAENAGSIPVSDVFVDSIMAMETFEDFNKNVRPHRENDMKLLTRSDNNRYVNCDNYARRECNCHSS
jgi:hypothetical protein